MNKHSDSLIDRFTSFIISNNLFHSEDRLLLAVSGGLDSIVLCELCEQAAFDFTIAHVNFQLRGEESDRDESFVHALGRKYNRAVLVKKFDTESYALKNRLSIQVAARELRYGWFASLINSDLPSAPKYILTAHHLDDNIETMMMNFFKGTGITGMRGMLAKHGNIVRPLLPFTKDELRAFAGEQQLLWVEDSSNEGDKYSRNYFRHHVIPLVRNIYPAAEANLASNIDRFKETEILYRQAVDLHKKKLLEYRSNEVHIPVLKLAKTIPLHSVVYEIIKDFGFTASQTGEVIDLLHSESGKFVASSSYRVIRNRNWLIIAPQAAQQASHILIEENDELVAFEQGSLSIQKMKADISSIAKDNNQAIIDLAAIKFPLLLRPWKQGDYFYPLGMKKKKKLARFFIDQKLSKTDKEKMWVLESNKKIVWVIGMRIDDRMRVAPNTKTVLTIKWSRA